MHQPKLQAMKAMLMAGAVMAFVGGAPSVLAQTSSAAASSDATLRRFTAMDLFALESAGDPQVSPDGRSIAYVRRAADIQTDRYRSSIWLIDVASGEARIGHGAGLL